MIIFVTVLFFIGVLGAGIAFEALQEAVKAGIVTSEEAYGCAEWGEDFTRNYTCRISK